MQPKVKLRQGEEVVFQDERAIVTNMRLIGNFTEDDYVIEPSDEYDAIELSDEDQAIELSDEDDEGYDAYELEEVGSPNKFNGGQYGKRAVGVRLLIGGAAVVLAGAILQPILQPDFRIEALVFVTGSIGAMVGLYILLNDLFRPPPNTTVIFSVFDGNDIIASYPEWDNPEAEELVRSFARVKRGMRR